MDCARAEVAVGGWAAEGVACAAVMGDGMVWVRGKPSALNPKKELGAIGGSGGHRRRMNERGGT